ncbi:polysaccharide deacetylase [Aurantiacibacter marinus]|uniref:Chitooligosaccharide deacetylase n=2 Tax=Aurantiacibacter marinus TaxID=874156 RepID=A0A0H0XY76_9SPHN|nr:polysaccharide deacetylase [Aurantiacibacter marinus]
MLSACATAPASSPEPPLGPTPADKRIALTFDDIPRHAGAFLEPDERAAILRQTLRDAGVAQAAFFINPARLHDRPGGVQHVMDYAADGHVLANHTATHPNLSDLTLEDYVADIDIAETWLSQLEGHRPWFRYPFLNEGRDDVAKRDGVRAALAQRGLSNGYVTVDASDWFYEQAAIEAQQGGHTMDMDAFRDLFVESHVEAAEFFDGLARAALGRSPAHVMLLHEADVTVLFLGDLIDALEARGWTVITADEAYADPFSQYAATYDTPSAQGTLTEQVAWERGLPAPRWYARNNVDLAREEFERRVLHQAAE